MSKIFLAVSALALLAACADPDGGYTFKERGDARNQYSIWASGSGALTSAPKGRDGYCNAQVFNTPASECGALGNDREKAEAAAKAGKPIRFVDRDGKVTTYTPKK